MSDAEKWADMIKEAGEPPTSRNLVTKLREYGGFDAAEDPTTSARSGVMTQYSPDGNKFYATGSTVPTLPPGVYAARVESRGVLFEKKSLAFDELLRLPDTRSDEVVEEIRRFWGLKEAFRAHGFVHKRGFLLFGPQGGGKTCTAMAVTQEIVEAGGIGFILDNPCNGAIGLQALREIEPDRPVIAIMEDVDTIVERFGEAEVLSVLDGEASIDNVVFVATTNYPERLEARFSNRPSRFDKIIHIGMPNLASRQLYISTKLKDASEGTVSLWAESTDGLSLAHIKELVVAVGILGEDLDETIARLRGMKRPPKSADFSGSKVGFGGR